MYEVHLYEPEVPKVLYEDEVMAQINGAFPFSAAIVDKSTAGLGCKIALTSLEGLGECLTRSRCDPAPGSSWRKRRSLGREPLSNAWPQRRAADNEFKTTESV